MKSPARFCLVAASVALLSVSSAHAQSNAEAGLIGKRYAGADFTYDHFNGSSVDKEMGAVAHVNLPLNPALDLGFSYRYADASGPNYGALDKALTGSLLTHRRTEWGTAYFVGQLGHSWHRLDHGTIGARDNAAFWGVRAGYEVPVGRQTSINAGIGYSDAFDEDIPRNQGVRYYAEANHWFSRDVAGVLSAAYRQIKQAPDSVSFGLGLRWAF